MSIGAKRDALRVRASSSNALDSRLRWDDELFNAP
jgi:hypothetical protein